MPHKLPSARTNLTLAMEENGEFSLKVSTHGRGGDGCMHEWEFLRSLEDCSCPSGNREAEQKARRDIEDRLWKDPNRFRLMGYGGFAQNWPTPYQQRTAMIDGRDIHDDLADPKIEPTGNPPAPTVG